MVDFLGIKCVQAVGGLGIVWCTTNGYTRMHNNFIHVLSIITALQTFFTRLLPSLMTTFYIYITRSLFTVSTKPITITIFIYNKDHIVRVKEYLCVYK